jgi:thiol-disulfide isomerase/thioredoxin
MSATKSPSAYTARKKPRTGPSPGVILGVVLGLVVLVALIVAIAVSVTNDDGSSAEGLEQFQPVSVPTGAPLPRFESIANDPAVGQQAPGLEGRSFDGTPVNVVPGDGPYLLAFGAHWCNVCQAEFPELERRYQDGDIPAGVEFVAIATGSSADLPNYPPSTWLLNRVGWSNPVMADDENYSAASAYGLASYPFLVAVAEDGTVAARSSGALNDDQFDLFVQAAFGS